MAKPTKPPLAPLISQVESNAVNAFAFDAWADAVRGLPGLLPSTQDPAAAADEQEEVTSTSISSGGGGGGGGSAAEALDLKQPRVKALLDCLATVQQLQPGHADAVLLDVEALLQRYSAARGLLLELWASQQGRVSNGGLGGPHSCCAMLVAPTAASNPDGEIVVARATAHVGLPAASPALAVPLAVPWPRCATARTGGLQRDASSLLPDPTALVIRLVPPAAGRQRRRQPPAGCRRAAGQAAGGGTAPGVATALQQPRRRHSRASRRAGARRRAAACTSAGEHQRRRSERRLLRSRPQPAHQRSRHCCCRLRQQLAGLWQRQHQQCGIGRPDQQGRRSLQRRRQQQPDLLSQPAPVAAAAAALPAPACAHALAHRQ
jgi:hypothetical protein